MDELIKHINTVMNLNEKDEMLIYEINYAYINDEILSMILKEQKMINEKIIIEKQIMKEPNEDEKSKLKDDRDKKINDIKLENKKIKKENNDIKEINDIFITFIDPKKAAYLFKLYDKNAFTRCCLICCCKREIIQNL